MLTVLPLALLSWVCLGLYKNHFPNKQHISKTEKINLLRVTTTQLLKKESISNIWSEEERQSKINNTFDKVNSVCFFVQELFLVTRKQITRWT